MATTAGGDGPGDRELVELARRDPTAGWAAIWDAHGPGLHAYCRRMLDHPSEADDAVADVFLVASRRLDQLRDEGALRAWLHAIARRTVQARWRQRSRTVPVDPHGERLVNVATHDAPVGADEAATLLDDAAAGLTPSDRELLALTLAAGLDTTEVARVTGERQNAVSVKVTRLKDTVARAAGALLVARHHRRDCDDLDAILASWDGTFDTVWRKRIARHIDGCPDCEERRRGAVAVFAAPLALAPPGDALRRRVLEPIAASSPATPPSMEPVDADGFPVPEPWPRSPGAGPGSSRRLAAVAAVAVLLALVIVAALVAGSGDDGVATTSAAVVDPTVSTTTAAPLPVPETSTTLTPSTAVPTTPPTTAPVPADDTSGEPVPPVATPDPVTTLPPSPPPTVRLSIDPAVVSSCANGAEATVEVGAGAGGETTVIAWGGGAPGSVQVDGPGTTTVAIGPFGSSGGAVVQEIPVEATTTDAAGHSDRAATSIVFEVLPC